MTEKERKKLLIQILRVSLSGEVGECSDSVSNDDIVAVCKMAKAHDLAHILKTGFAALKIEVPASVSEKLDQLELLSIFRSEKMKYELASICELLSKESIPFIPLKGSVLRPFYPKENMRTSSDIDLFVKKNDIPNIQALFESKLSYKRSGQSRSEVSFMSKGGVHIELHFFDGDETTGDFAGFENIFDIAEKKDDGAYHLPDNIFLYYHISHMAKHFSNGGCGIRPFMDIYVMKHFMGIDLTEADALFEKYGYLKFARSVIALFSVWFESGSHTPLTAKIEDYIMNAGVYGSLENSGAAIQLRTGKKKSSLKRRIFMPYRNMKYYYPSVKICPVILFPLYQVRRWVRVLFRRGVKDITRKIKADISVTDEQVNDMSRLFSELELKF